MSCVVVNGRNSVETADTGMCFRIIIIVFRKMHPVKFDIDDGLCQALVGEFHGLLLKDLYLQPLPTA